jgi:hypothetical protein
MAAGTWKVFTRAKRNLCTTATGIHLDGVFRMSLHSTGASANLLKFTNTGISIWSEVASEITAQGGYAAGGRSVPAIKWTVGASTKQMKFSYTTAGLVFTASGAALASIKYAVIRNSTSAAGGKVLCFCTLSTTAFTISSPNTLTVLPAATGVFTLA